MSLSKSVISVDSFQLFLNDCLPKLRRIEEMLSLIGIFFIGKFLLSTFIDLSRGIGAHFVSRLFKKDFSKKYGNWAVVTGCTDGIGLAYAEELAKNGMDIILISRNEAKLKNTALELTTKYSINTEIIQADFLEGREVFKKIEMALKHKEIGMLVNNVGILLDAPKIFHKCTDDEIWGQINVNVAPVSALMRMVLPSMIARKKGAVVNIASIAAVGPSPFFGIYSASKVFIEYLSEACAEEYSNSNITIQTLTPSYVCTKMLDYNGVFTKMGFIVPSASSYASAALNTLGWSKSTTGYWPHGIQKWFLSHFVTKYIFMKSVKFAHMMLSHGKLTSVES